MMVVVDISKCVTWSITASVVLDRINKYVTIID